MGICVLVAVITPSGDPISMLMLSVPMVLFYEVSIIVGPRAGSGGGSGRRGQPDGHRAELVGGYDFALDPFQLRAIDALDAGRSVLVAAPTGSGKTVVAEYAVAKALAEGRQGLLHGADQGAVEPEVRRPRPSPRRRARRAAHRRQRRSTATPRSW